MNKILFLVVCLAAAFMLTFIFGHWFYAQVYAGPVASVPWLCYSTIGFFLAAAFLMRKGWKH